MTSTYLSPEGAAYADWRADGLRYYSVNCFYRWRFGQKVRKVTVDAGMTCPNRDGSVGVGGCIFCDPGSFSPSRRLGVGSIGDQIQAGVKSLRRSGGNVRFLAYFQPASNTYAPVERLRQFFDQALVQPGIVGMIVGTRPDCVADETLDLLAEFAQRTWVSVEFGLQSVHDASLRWMNRGHSAAAFFDAVARGRQRGLHIGAHVILGLPGEGDAEVRTTATTLAAAGIESIKLHNLHAVKGTRLAELVATQAVELPTLDNYVRWAVDFLERLPPSCVIDRLSGDAYADCLVGPDWAADKAMVRRRIETELAIRDAYQGRLWRA